MQERLERVPFPRPVHVAFPDDEERPHRCVAGNISYGGMFVRGEARPKEGTPVALSLEAKGRLYPFAEGEVVWRADPEAWTQEGRVPGFGVRFTRFLHPRSDSLIEHMMERHVQPLPPEVGEQLVGAPEAEPPSFVVEPAPTPSWIGSELADKELDLGGEIPPTAPTQVPPVRWGAAALMVTALVAVAVGGVFFARSRVQALPQAGAQTVIPAPHRPGTDAEEAHAAFAQVDVAQLAPATPPSAVVKPVPEAAATAARTPTPSAPVAAPTPQPTPAPTPAPTAARAPAPAPAPSVKGHAALPSGGATALSWRQGADGAIEVKVSLADGAGVDRVFALKAPSRLVIDLTGDSPSGSARADGDGAVVGSVRVGAREGGTRLVLDLSGTVAKVEQQGPAHVRFTLAR